MVGCGSHKARPMTFHTLCSDAMLWLVCLVASVVVDGVLGFGCAAALTLLCRTGTRSLPSVRCSKTRHTSDIYLRGRFFVVTSSHDKPNGSLVGENMQIHTQSSACLVVDIYTYICIRTTRGPSTKAATKTSRCLLKRMNIPYC